MSLSKFLFFKITFVFFFLHSFGQTDIGNRTIGLNIGYYNRTGVNEVVNQTDYSINKIRTKKNTFDIGINYSRFIASKLDVGVNFNYGSEIERNIGGNFKTDSYNLGATIYLRKYLLYENKFGLRAGPYFGIHKGISTNISIQDTPENEVFETLNKSFNGGLLFDIVYFPIKNIGISSNIASLDYERFISDSKSNGNEKLNTINLNVINKLQLSVFYVFGIEKN